MSRTGLGKVNAGAALALMGAFVLLFAALLIGVLGWPGLGQTDAAPQVVIEAPAEPVVLGGEPD